MIRWLWIGLVMATTSLFAFVQQQGGDLEIEDTRVIAQVDAFGVEQQLAVGTLLNNSRDAYTNLQIFAEIYDEDEELIGEGFGFLVNQCGKSVPPDFVLQPGVMQRFSIPLEFYSEDADYDEIVYFPEGTTQRRERSRNDDLADGVMLVSEQEIAGMEWVLEEVDVEADAATEEVVSGLLYGVGCYRDVFTTYDWYRYTLEDESNVRVEHPRYDEATDEETRERLELTDDTLFNRSYLTYPPNGGGRLVHQDRINTLITAEADGTFRRILDDELFRSTLQGINWLPNERFVAYYYGAFGDGVTYLVGSSAGGYFSTPERFSVPSVTVPGAIPDISRLIISGTFNQDETPGFYLKAPAAEFFERLFEWENLPGNNYPAPVYKSRGGLQIEDVIYFALPDDNDEPHLYCYDRAEEELMQLVPIPLELGTEDRADMRLSPDGEWIALGANGVNGGLWLLDLSAFDACYP